NDVPLADAAAELGDVRNWIPPSVATRCELKLFARAQFAEDVAAYAADTHADLIAAGEPADRSLPALLRGTFSERIVQRAHCPVLTVNMETALSDEESVFANVGANYERNR